MLSCFLISFRKPILVYLNLKMSKEKCNEFNTRTYNTLYSPILKSEINMKCFLSIFQSGFLAIGHIHPVKQLMEKRHEYI